MSITLSQVAPSNFLAPAAPLVLLNVDHRFEYLRVTNNSPYQLSINLTGTPITLSEFTIKDVEVPAYWQGQLTVTPTVNISTASHAQSNLLTIEGYYKGEIDSPISQQIPQQAVTATASGKPIYSASVGFGNTTTVQQVLNVFNPPNSGVSFTFHSCRVFTNDSTNPTANLQFNTGGDNNLSTPVAAIAHNAQANPPVSFAHVTAQDAIESFTGRSNIETVNLQQGVTIDVLTFPDTVTLAPGDNLWIETSSGVTGKVVRLTFKWSEDIAVAPQGGVLTGMAITTLVNQGNPAPTPIVTASPSGDGATATLINNDGSSTLGDTLHPGHVVVQSATQFTTVDPGAVTTPKVALTLGSITRISKFTGTASTTPTFFNHGLGAVPDVVLLQLNGTSATAHSVWAEYATMTTTQVKVTGDGANAFVGLAILF